MVKNPEYVLLDGDQVGLRIEDLLLRNELSRLYLLIQDLDDAVLGLSRLLRAAGGLVYVCGGDGILGSADDLRPFLGALRKARILQPCTFSAGVGDSVRDALIALKLAKARGPGEILRLRRVRGELRTDRWEDPAGWREEPAPSTARQARPAV